MKSETFKTFTASMIALVTVISSMVAWRASMAGQDAGDADLDGLVAIVNAAEARTLTTVTSMEHYKAFLAYTRYNELGKSLTEAMQANPSNREALNPQKSSAWTIAFGLQEQFFSSRYLRTDGTYDLEREQGELLADAQHTRDTDPDLHYAQADGLRTKANLMVGMLIVLGISFWFFTLAQIFEHNIKYFFALLGGLLMIAGTVAALGVEFFW